MKIIEDLALRPEAILKLLGRESADSAVISMLRNHGANRYRPSLDEEDPDVMTDWFPVPDLGIEFGFKDEAFLKGWDPLGRRACPLIFHELI